jgi:quercetin dioxygenase-like cupin family protein
MDEPRTPGAKRAGPGEYVFNMHDVNSIMGGPGYSPVFGGCVEGERMIVALMRYPAGKPSDAHSHPNEQWIFILEGELEMQSGMKMGQSNFPVTRTRAALGVTGKLL